MEVIKNSDSSVGYKEKIYLENGRTATKTFWRKSDATMWKRQMQMEKSKNLALGIQPLRENLCFGEIFELWMQTKIRPLRSPKTIADYASIGNKHLTPSVGSLRIRSLARRHAEDLTQHLKTIGLANKTTNKILMVFKQVMGFAEVQGYVARSPLRYFPMLAVTRGRIDHLSHGEVVQLLRSNAANEIYPLLVVALNTGMRIGELTGLCWDRIDFEREIIEVSRCLTRNGLKESTKTNLVRYIPMNPEVKAVLFAKWRAQQDPKFVFVGLNGRPYNPDHFNKRHFQEALQRAGLRRVTFHLLRHTYASHWVMNGGNVYDLQKVLGHTKVTMTSVYAHLSPEYLRSAVNVVRFCAEGNKSVSPFIAPRTEGAKISLVP